MAEDVGHSRPASLTSGVPEGPAVECRRRAGVQATSDHSSHLFLPHLPRPSSPRATGAKMQLGQICGAEMILSSAATGMHPSEQGIKQNLSALTQVSATRLRPSLLFSLWLGPCLLASCLPSTALHENCRRKTKTVLTFQTGRTQ
jgi:hypothetical protein